MDNKKNLEENEQSYGKRDWLLFLIMLFAFGGVFGFIYEELFYRIDLGYWVKRGTTFGPWIPLYAFGGLGIYLMTFKVRKHPLAVFALSAVVTGIIEYGVGYMLFYFFDGLRLWDYNVEIWNWGNIDGFICIRSVLFFALSGLFLMYLVVPVMQKIYKKIGMKKFGIIAISCSSIAVLDIIASFIYRAIG